MDRREFLKRASQIGGIAALSSLGIRDSHGLGIGHASLFGSSGVSTPYVGSGWSTWDEITESGWGDSSNTFICLMENTTANGNESGLGGGLSGSNLTLTLSAGSLGGATGTPPYRHFVSTDNPKLSVTATTANTFFTVSTFTVIMKVNTFNNSSGNFDYMLQMYDGSSQQVSFGSGSGNTLYAYIKDGIGGESFLTTDAMSASGNVYVCLMCGPGYCRIGFLEGSTKPTKWSDFGANDRVATTKTLNLTSTWTSSWVLGMTASRLDYYCYYIIMSKKELIDPNS